MTLFWEFWFLVNEIAKSINTKIDYKMFQRSLQQFSRYRLQYRQWLFIVREAYVISYIWYVYLYDNT